MRVITAPDKIETPADGAVRSITALSAALGLNINSKSVGHKVSCFLAGGITGCPEWQQQIIKLLDKYDGVLYNPRRPDFPINNPDAACEQITWEYAALGVSDVFSMWFSNSASDQPICFYELGRYVTMYSMLNKINNVVIGVEKGFRRSQDIYIQVGLINQGLASRISDNLEQHANNIVDAMRVCKDEWRSNGRIG